jgi:hypothetical protein
MVELWAEKSALISGEEHNYGILNLCNYGCGVSLFLVVNGLEKGNMWTDQRAYDLGIYPTNEEEFGSATRISFLDWYEKWLDHSIDEIKGQH